MQFIVTVAILTNLDVAFKKLSKNVVLGIYYFADNKKRFLERLTRWSSSRFRTRIILNVAALGVARLARTYERYIERISRHVDIGPLLAPPVLGCALLQSVRLNRVDFSTGCVIDLVSYPGVQLLLGSYQISNRGARVGRIGLARIHRAPHGGAECKYDYRIRSRRDYASGSDRWIHSRRCLLTLSQT